MHQLIDKKNKIIIYLIFFLILSTFNNKTYRNLKDYSISINKIDVMGLSNNNNLKIVNELSNFFYKNIFFIDKEEINRIISTNPIIDRYEIKKIYPQRLNVIIEPTKFIAKIYDNDEVLVGSNGKIITSEKTDKVLPYIDGEFNSKEFLIFKKKIDQSQFDLIDIKLLYLHPSKRWDILTINNILIKLPEKNLLKSLDLAHKIITNDQFNDSNIIDLRIPNRLILE
jgi:cell division septal protein FtsQ|tara:strand:- start:286 stop:963 length:678 start_codon:yes stop_codon:yes gene_type:complete